MQNHSYISLVCSLRLEPFFLKSATTRRRPSPGRRKQHHGSKGQNRHRVWGQSMNLALTNPFKKSDKTPKRGKQLSMTVISCFFKSNIKTYYNKGEKTVSRDSQLDPLNIGVCLLYCWWRVMTSDFDNMAQIIFDNYCWWRVMLTTWRKWLLQIILITVWSLLDLWPVAGQSWCYHHPLWNNNRYKKNPPWKSKMFC